MIVRAASASPEGGDNAFSQLSRYLGEAFGAVFSKQESRAPFIATPFSGSIRHHEDAVRHDFGNAGARPGVPRGVRDLYFGIEDEEGVPVSWSDTEDEVEDAAAEPTGLRGAVVDALSHAMAPKEAASDLVGFTNDPVRRQRDIRHRLR